MAVLEKRGDCAGESAGGIEGRTVRNSYLSPRFALRPGICRSPSVTFPGRRMSCNHLDIANSFLA